MLPLGARGEVVAAREGEVVCGAAWSDAPVAGRAVPAPTARTRTGRSVRPPREGGPRVGLRPGTALGRGIGPGRTPDGPGRSGRDGGGSGPGRDEPRSWGHRSGSRSRSSSPPRRTVRGRRDARRNAGNELRASVLRRVLWRRSGASAIQARDSSRTAAVRADHPSRVRGLGLRRAPRSGSGAVKPRWGHHPGREGRTCYRNPAGRVEGAAPIRNSTRRQKMTRAG